MVAERGASRRHRHVAEHWEVQGEGPLPEEEQRTLAAVLNADGKVAESGTHAQLLAARMLDINRSTLFNKMRKYGLLDRTFASPGS